MHYSLDLNYNCNNDCLFCFNKYDKNKSFDIKQVRKEIDWASKNQFDILDFYGGEPLLYNDDLLKILEYAHEKGLKSGIATNATLLDDKIVKIFNELGVVNCRTSMHGHNKVLHDMVTQRKGSFEKTSRGINSLINYFNGEIIINIVITKLNYKYLPDIVLHICKLDPGKKAAIKFSNLIYNHNNDVYRKIGLSLSATQPVVYKVIKNIVKDRKFYIEKYPYCFLKPFSKNFIIEKDLGREIIFWHNDCAVCKFKNKSCVGLNINYVNYIQPDIGEIKKLNNFKYE